MYFVYAGFVSQSQVRVMENCFDMWWDLIAEGFWFELEWGQGITSGDVAVLEKDSRALLDAMFGTVKRILELPDLRTQRYALHGLGHLHHPGVSQVVQSFIDRNGSEFSELGLKWAEQCRDGTVM